MESEREGIIGTFLYAVSFKTYDLHHLIFTTRRLITANSGWEKASLISDSANIIGNFIIMMPLPGGSLKTLLMQRWSDMKRENRGRTTVNYQDPASEKVLNLGFFKMALHEIWSRPYSAIKIVNISEYPLTEDYKIRFDFGPFKSATFLIPDYSIKEFKELASKTPLANKLADKTLGILNTA